MLPADMGNRIVEPLHLLPLHDAALLRFQFRLIAKRCRKHIDKTKVLANSKHLPNRTKSLEPPRGAMEECLVGLLEPFDTLFYQNVAAVIVFLFFHCIPAHVFLRW